MRTTTTAAVAALAATLAAAPAQAHVTVQPRQAPAGEFTRLDVRVPNERDEAGTTKVAVKFPPGFIFLSTEPRDGWTAEVAKRKLAEPVEVFGEKQTEEVDTVTFRARKGERIEPGQFVDFGLSVALPDKPGETLTFRAVQTYDNGETVRWIGPPDAEEPAPQVELVAAEAQHGAGGAAADGGGRASGGGQAAAAGGAEAEDDDEGASTGLAVAALIFGALGLLAGVAGLATARRARVGAT
ncbi:MAG TPA: YcnI family protein [Solirubrobacteraceae bacterium]|nr:YcnI family protein [Solirubrobacteraceae bacterium]